MTYRYPNLGSCSLQQQRPGISPDLIESFETLKLCLPIERSGAVVLGYDLFSVVGEGFGLR